MTHDDNEPPGRVRIDKWLWAARFYKTRGLSAEALDGGKIEVNGERAKRSRLVQAGDRIRVRIGPYEHVVLVKAVSERRGSAPIAQALYEEDAESRKAREAMAAHVRAMNANTGYESGRPTKKDRRDIERLKRRG
jgi:ribosome-associated heat shock protein Hsp15